MGGRGTSGEVFSESVSASRYTHSGTLIASSHHIPLPPSPILSVAIVRVFLAPLLCISPFPDQHINLAEKIEGWRWGNKEALAPASHRLPSHQSDAIDWPAPAGPRRRQFLSPALPYPLSAVSTLNARRRHAPVDVRLLTLPRRATPHSQRAAGSEWLAASPSRGPTAESCS